MASGGAKDNLTFVDQGGSKTWWSCTDLRNVFRMDFMPAKSEGLAFILKIFGNQ